MKEYEFCEILIYTVNLFLQNVFVIKTIIYIKLLIYVYIKALKK